MGELQIVENELPEIKMWNGQRVVTFKDIDEVHQRTKGTARRNFNANKKHFIDEVDYIVRNSYEAKQEYNIIAPNGLTLLTESGYLMIVKSFTDDLSWDVQRRLVNSYFRQKEEHVERMAEKEQEINLLEDKPKVPMVKSWYDRNRGRIERLLLESNQTRKYAYHKILSRVGEKYDLKEANRLYEQATGHEPEYRMDLIEFFPELAEEADKYLDRVENQFFPR